VTATVPAADPRYGYRGDGSAVRPGRPFPLGATADAGGTNFAVASDIADGVVLCLFDEHGDERRVPLVDLDHGVWHGYVDGVGPGQAYGYRTTGPWNPRAGHWCNPAKLLLDPYAKATTGTVRFGPEVLAYDPDDPAGPSGLDSAAHMPRSLVVDPTAFDWGDDEPLHRRYADTVIYELHVKGFTMTHPGVPAELRGTYAGLAHDAAVGHLVDLGITAVELLPVHQFVPEAFLVAKGLTNYWGYNTIGFFAPHEGYSAAARAGRVGGQVDEMKAMVKALHGAGIEVILDVVYNHTAEAGADGPSLCHRGLDNPAYYRLDPQDRSRYLDTTGCHNALNAGDPRCLQLIMDSLRYWVTEMHVDGFRFDLAPTLARQEQAFDRRSAFFDLVAQDPVVSRTKLIAEPWDVGQGDSYDIGAFPSLWSEWNGRYRDTVRDFWRRRDGLVGELATRLAGSSDLYGGGPERRPRRPTASVNLVTVHDGFTLADLVAYDTKHNEANGEDNHDGNDDNRSWNSGVEGPTQDPDVLDRRGRRARATLLLSAGVPLVLSGDELGRTQHGNNNAYCHDDELTWIDWAHADPELIAFTRRLVALRRDHPVLRRRRFLTGADASALRWFTPAGTGMTGADWADPQARAVAVHFDGTAEPDRDRDGVALVDDDLLVLINGWWEPLAMVVPDIGTDRSWLVELDTGRPRTPPGEAIHRAGAIIAVAPESITVLRSPRP
jgi:isoamylase